VNELHPLSGLGIDHAGMEILTLEECHGLLRSTPVGRIAFLDRGEPMVLPVTIALWGESIVFATDRGSKMEVAVMLRPVAVEIDGWDAATHTGWSVVVRGSAVVVDGDDAAELDRLHLEAWVRPEQPKQWVRVLPTEVTGRRIPEDRGITTT
jgi:nitroimidazol reductase NimA-like FMN-containing flavoprotein (pyridoxamine 5'-phosphate oxidase superfamily)